MTAAAHELIVAFDALPPADQRQVVAALLRRSTATGDLPDAAFDELAAELFRSYDAEEAARADP